jgi:hypothetical protein
MAIQHPLPRGTKVALVEKVIDLDADDEERTTPAGSIGRITGIATERNNGDEGFCYDLEFDNGVWLTVDDDELDDISRFKLL